MLVGISPSFAHDVEGSTRFVFRHDLPTGVLAMNAIMGRSGLTKKNASVIDFFAR
jgi:hypothetical protein